MTASKELFAKGQATRVEQYACKVQRLTTDEKQGLMFRIKSSIESWQHSHSHQS